MGQPDTGDVHVSTALSNTKRKRKRRKGMAQRIYKTITRKG